MKCSQIQQKMMDILYGELLDSRICFEFFRHLKECQECNREYMELVQTRGMLSEWKVEERFERDLAPIVTASAPADPGVGAWWRSGLSELRPLLQRAAAVVLMVVGALALLQQAGFSIGGEQVVRFTEPELQQYIDLAVQDNLEAERNRIDKQLQILWEDLRLEQHRQVSKEFEGVQLYLRQIVHPYAGGQALELKRTDDR